MAHTILIVDDLVTTRHYVSAEREQLGDEVIEAADGATALQPLDTVIPARR